MIKYLFKAAWPFPTFAIDQNAIANIKPPRGRDYQVKVCFITAGEMHYEKVRKGKPEEDEEEEEQYCELNTERFLRKPISNADLIKRINKIMMLNLSPNIQNT